MTATGHTESIHGIEMYCETRGEGPPLVLLHGFGGCGDNWSFFAEELAREHRLVIPDLRGHGRSTNPSGEFTFRQAALDVLALLDRLGIETCRGIGVSGGGQTLLHMATGRPERIAAMVLVSAAPSFPETARAIMRQSTVESHGAEEWQLMRQWHRHGDDQIRAIWTWAHNLKDSYDDVNFTAEDLARISAPTLLVHGDRDPLYPVQIAVDLYHAIPKSCLWIMPNAGHSAIFTDLRHQFLATASAFLRGGWVAPSF